jgi:hypothetical protein
MLRTFRIAAVLQGYGYKSERRKREYLLSSFALLYAELLN